MTENAQGRFPCGTVLCDVKNNKWIIKSFIGNSGSMEVYAGAVHNEKVALDYSATIQVEPDHNGCLSTCMQFFLRHAKPKDIDRWVDVKKMKNNLHLVRLIGSGSYKHNQKKYNFIILTQYDTDVEKLFLENGRRLSAPTVYKIALEMLPVLEYIHSTGYVHADIKGENLLVNLKNQGHIYLTLSHLVLDYSTKVNDVNLEEAHYGNLKYSSRDHHLRVPSMRGDLEMLLFNMVRWLCNSLPWDVINDPIIVQQMKEKAFKDTNKFLQDCFKSSEVPAPINVFMSLLATVDRDDEPQYNKFSCILRKGLMQLGHRINDGLHSKVNNVRQTEISNNKEMPKHNEKSLPEVNNNTTNQNLNDLETAPLQSRLNLSNDRNEPASLAKDMRVVTSRLESLRPRTLAKKQIAKSAKRKVKFVKEKTQKCKKSKKTKLPNEETEQLDELNKLSGGDNTNNPNQESSLSPLDLVDPTIRISQITQDSPSTSSFPSLISPASSSGTGSQSVFRSEESSPLGKSEEQDKYLHICLGMLDKISETFRSISLEPHMADGQVQDVLVLREQFRKEQSRLDDLSNELAKLPANSTHAESIKRILRLWQNLLDRLEERGQKLSYAYLSHLDGVLKDTQDKMIKLSFENYPKDQLLREVESFSELLKAKRILLTNAKTMTDQLCRSFNDSAYNFDLRAKAESLEKIYNDLQRSLVIRTAEIETSLCDERHFDKVYLWLDEELISMNENLLLTTDCAALRRQLHHCEDIYQRAISRKVEVMQLLNSGRQGLPRFLNLESRMIQERYLDSMQSKWDRLMNTLDIRDKLQVCLEHGDKYYKALNPFLGWLSGAEKKLKNFRLTSFKHVNDIRKHQNNLSVFATEVRKKLGESNNCASLGDTFVSSCDKDKDDLVRNELVSTKERWEKLNAGLLLCIQSIEETLKQFSKLSKCLQDLKRKLQECEDGVTVSSDAPRKTATDSKLLDRIKKLREKTASLQEPLDELRRQVTGLARKQNVNISYLSEEMDLMTVRIARLKAKLDDNCSEILEQQQEMNPPQNVVNAEQEQTEVKVPMLPLLETKWPSIQVIDLTNSEEGEVDEEFATTISDTQQHAKSNSQEEDRLDKHAEANEIDVSKTLANDELSVKANVSKKKSNETCAKSNEGLKQNGSKDSRLEYDLKRVYKALTKSINVKNSEREPREVENEKNPLSTDVKDEDV